MDKRIAIVVLFSLTVAALASYLVYAMLVRQLGTSRGKSGSRAFVAARDLATGSLVQESDLREAEVAIAVPGSPASKEEMIGRGVTSPIYAGEPVLEARLSPKGSGGGLAALIRPGLRAAAVRVNEVVGVSGFVRPGMHVDVITSGAPPGSTERNTGTMSRIVLQNLEVLSAGQDLDRDKDGKAVSVQVVNLLVSPEQAEVLTLASNEARVQLILRNPLDSVIAKTPGINTSAMFNAGDPRPVSVQPVTIARARPAPRPAPATVAVLPQPITVEVVNGGKREIVTVGQNPIFRGVAQ